MRFVVLLTLTFLAHAHAAEMLPGHSLHGEAFDDGPRQAAVLIEGCGNVHLTITTKNAEAQKFFDQGIGQLHGFWYYEAERSFRQVVMLDPDCAMAYWGCAMANVNNEKRAAEFIKKAVEKNKDSSAREKAWIESLDHFYRDLKKDKKARNMDFIKDIENVIHDYPEEIEAKAFLAWAIWHAKDAGVPMVSREAVDAIIAQVLAKEPMHPVHHYRIHLWDDGKPIRALVSAAQCGQSAPAIAHMWHMPGHTFSKLDREEDAAWQQDAATRVDHAYMIRTQILPDQIHNYAHNTEWFIRTLNQIGHAKEAVGMAKNFIEIPRHPKYNSVEKQSNSAAYGRTRLLETLLKFEQWDTLLALDGSPYLDITQNPSYEANRMRALGIAAYFKEDRAALLKRITELESLKANEATKLKKETAATSKAKLTADKKTSPEKPATTDKPSEKKEESTEVKSNVIVENALSELKALSALQNKKSKEDVIRLLDLAKDTPKDRLVRYQLKIGNKDKAVTLAQQLPNDAPGLALRVDVLVQCEKTEDAKKQFETARKASAALDADLPMSQRLDAIAVQLGLPIDWRTPPAAREDSGKRPTLDSLGPQHWHPFTPAPFVLPSSGAETVSLNDLKGKPTVVLFYLGHTCTHCMAQLKAFSAAAADFKNAGIEIVAIGSETPTDLVATADTCQTKEAPPIKLLADPEYKVFKAWRCYDDFEGMGMHGAFLLDAEGQVRWMDVSYDPFTDTKFLLGEAKRLLKF
ncbi:hypothetical protein BH11VER1_BH11VER1_14450 [soil metagenome]